MQIGFETNFIIGFFRTSENFGGKNVLCSVFMLVKNNKRIYRT